jgi:serine/threonine protein kinase
VFLVMELLDGESFEARRVRSGNVLPAIDVLKVADRVLDVLATAHEKGIVHRDIKPDNIFLTRDGGVKLLDFGIARLRDSMRRATMTSGGAIGTPAFMPPEQAAGDPVDARGDVYALGAVAYFALTGRPPHEGKTARQILAAVLTEPVPPLARVPADLAAVVARCLARDPADRFATVQDLDRALAGCGCSADWSGDLAVAAWQAEREGLGSPDGETQAVG